jgi:hypothetical protein
MKKGSSTAAYVQYSTTGHFVQNYVHTVSDAGTGWHTFFSSDSFDWNRLESETDESSRSSQIVCLFASPRIALVYS